MEFLSEEQTDALVEIFNISIGRAASALSRMVHEEISLDVPSLEFIPAHAVGGRLYGGNTQRICGIVQHFDGPFKTDAILMFPEDRSLEIVRMLLGESYSVDELSELEQEAMSEIGNILLNACIGSIADITHTQFESSLPEVRLGKGDELMRVDEKSAADFVLLVYIDFIIASRTIQGYMAFLMDVPSRDGLIQSVDHFLTPEPH